MNAPVISQRNLSLFRCFHGFRPFAAQQQRLRQNAKWGRSALLVSGKAETSLDQAVPISAPRFPRRGERALRYLSLRMVEAEILHNKCDGRIETQHTLFSTEPLCDGGVLLHGFAQREAPQLFALVSEMAAASPFRHMITPGGFRMSIAITNCGKVGWISDRKGYRYAAIDPETDKPWPAMPPLFSELAERAATAGGFPGFTSDACLINRYEPGARLTLHQDKNELDFTQPIVSVSLGLPATFLFGGDTRKERPRRYRLESGDVVVWGGPARLAFHGVAPLKDGVNDLTGACRINLTFRKAL